ncbi:MAG: DNA polymerase IV [Bacteroidales bacterium]
MDLRKIIHIDMDAFYASVEQRDFPELKGKPVVVGSSEARGVVSAASYEARKYGIRSAMPGLKAKSLCPHAIFVNPRMNAYREVSRQIHEIFSDYTDLIEPLSYDEAFLDVTINKKNIALAMHIAAEIKQRIKTELDLTASAGVSYNKFLAKLASDYRKPDGLCIIHPDAVDKFLLDLPIEAFWGVGKVTAEKMKKLGITNGFELRSKDIHFLSHHFGKQGLLYYQFSRGIDHRQVENTYIRKSVGCENTFEEDLYSISEMKEELNILLPDLMKRIERNNFKSKTLTLKVKYKDFSIKSKSKTVNRVLDEATDILELAFELLDEIIIVEKGVRLLGLSLSLPYRKSEPECQLLLPFPDFDF